MTNKDNSSGSPMSEVEFFDDYFQNPNDKKLEKAQNEENKYLDILLLKSAFNIKMQVNILNNFYCLLMNTNNEIFI